ncbi:MAG: tRNA pseudouridine(38-40) synthase TruA [bacterium]
MNKILLIFSYDGSKFHGFQRQKNVRSVQRDIEEALTGLFGSEILIKGAGRTDSKVHAYAQCAHFEVEGETWFLKYKLNKVLKDIKIKKVKKVKESFHARYSVKEKTYIYKMTLNKNDDNRYYGYYYGNVDFDKITKCSQLFVGEHNFKNFVAGYRDNYVSYINSINVTKKGDRIYFVFKGHGFYRYMVRNIVGALIDASKDKCTYKELESMLTLYEVEKRLSTAKAEGLYLKKIKYDKKL